MPSVGALRHLRPLAVAGLALVLSLGGMLVGPDAAHATPGGLTAPDSADNGKTLRPVSKRDQRILHARSIALRQIGDPYRYGASGPRSFDCSGLVYYSFRHAGFKRLPRTSSAQARFARHIPKAKLRPGDLMFFRGGSGVYHVGVFLKRTRGHVVMVHSPSPGHRVQRAVPWTKSWFAGTLRRR